VRQHEQAAIVPAQPARRVEVGRRFHQPGHRRQQADLEPAISPVRRVAVDLDALDLRHVEERMVAVLTCRHRDPSAQKHRAN
jgi:hypothetical protein